MKSTTYPDSAFIAGTVAMAFAGDFLVPSIETSIGDKFEYGAMPMPRDKIAATDLGGNAIVAAKDGKNTEAAAKFLAVHRAGGPDADLLRGHRSAAHPEVADHARSSTSPSGRT